MAAPSTRDAATHQFLTFRLEDRRYALPVEEVAEVIRMPAVARVPQSPQGLLGLTNLRGVVVPVASGRGLLGQGPAASTVQARAIVLENALPVALAVDCIDGLIEVPAHGMAPAQMASLPGEKLRGAFQVADGAVKILDLQALMAAAFTPRPRKQAAIARGVAAALLQAPAEQREKLLTFEVAGQEYALPLASVQEVAAAPQIATGIPHTQAVVRGVIGFRGSLLPLLSLRILLGFGQGQPGGNEKIVVTRVAGGLVGLVADRMTGILAASSEQIEEVPQMLAARMGGESRIRSIYRREDGKRLVPVLGPQDLFGDDVMRKLEAAGSRPDMAPPQAQGSTAQFVVFRLGEEEFGLPIAAVEEVQRLPGQITRIPKTPKFLEGVVNLRGDVLPVIDQRRRFNMPPGDGDGRRLVVVRTPRHRAGLIVDSVCEVLRIPEDDIAPAPALAGERDALVTGVANLAQAGRIVLLLDPAELLTRAEQGLLDKFVPAEPPAS